MVWDAVVVGAGIAGASVAFFLSDRYRVLLLERESQPGYHSSGRSAAIYTENYGSDTVSALVRASGPFLKAPPRGFASGPLLEPLGVMTICDEKHRAVFEAALENGRKRVSNLELHNTQFALEKAPILRREKIDQCFWEPDAFSINVHSLHWGYIHGLISNGASLVNGADVTSISRQNGKWD